MTANELRAKVCAQARQWLGAHESDCSHAPIIDLYNTIRPLPRGYKMTYSDAWCAAFVSAVGAACGLSDVILPECACDPMIAAYKARGRWKAGGAYAAQPGDLIFYDWGNDGSSDHVGIVTDATVSALTVIEGNYSDAVRKRTVSRGFERIIGFALPDYESAADGTEADAAGGVSPSPTDAAVDGIDPSGASATSPYAGEAKAQGSQKRETVTIELPVLRYGCCGLHVVIAQGILIARKYSVGPDGADGDYGRNTQNGVKNFQRGAGITADGVIGKETWRKLLGV